MKTIIHRLVYIILLVASASSLWAQDGSGKDFYETGEYEMAKSRLLKGGATDAANLYYLGDLYFREKNSDSAQYYFNAGLQADPENILNKIGLAKVQLAATGTPDELNKIAGDKKNKKNGTVITLVAEAFMENNRTKEALTMLDQAIKVDSKNPRPYMLKGDYIASQGNTGEAAALYENARYFDANYKPAYVKLARLYENIKTQVALDYLKQVIALDPSYVPGQFVYSQINYRKGFYPESLSAFKKYLSLVKPETRDYERYASVLYFNKMYSEAIEAIKKAPDNLVMNRLKTYSFFELGEYVAALESANNFFGKFDKSNFITQDYTYYAQILKKNNKFAEAAAAYAEAYKREDHKLEYLTEAAKAYEKAEDYGNAIKFYKLILEKNSNPSLADYYTLGAAYYSAGTTPDSLLNDPQKDQIQKKEYLTEADSTFGKMTELFPDHYLGYLMRARALFALDPQAEQGLAVPYYTKALEIMLPDLDKRKNDILESYRYLGFYHLGKNDTQQAKFFWNKVLEYEPTDETALQVIKSLK
ncbi:MAG: tetratricopeptide repeat protein [Porphyromonadaceae bacterium]|nr:tetratricopeptide repeat protein [Porphyromonadaceae bacterium]